jgi:hypothetical protein
MAAKMRLRSSTLSRRVAEVEAEVARRFHDRVLTLLCDAINAAPQEIEIRRAIVTRLRTLWARQADDPAWNADLTKMILVACSEVAPALVAGVAAELGIELTSDKAHV